MKIHTGITFIIISMALAVSCGASLKVISDYDKNIDFKQYKTFAVDTVGIKNRLNRLNIDRITNAMKVELVKKGFSENTSGPDLKVSAAAIIKDKQSAAANTGHYGGTYNPWAGPMGYTTYDLQNHKDGSLLISIADAKTNKLIWEGIGNKKIKKSLKNPDTEIQAIVTSVMANFPPQKK